ncbi:MAG: hypothetical protein P1U46_03925 [Patescibacteria group bacterium]|nr:hypothetical protein [Patescibacteria group bacterium]
MFFSINSLISFCNLSLIISLLDTIFTSSSSLKASIILVNLRALSKSSISISFSGTKSILDSSNSIHLFSKTFSTL